MDKIALFTTTTENNIENTIISFQTYKSKNDIFDYFVIGNFTSQSSVDRLYRFGIKHINLDLSNVYKTEKDWPYPSECFWLFKGPDIFYNLGYKYSMYVDIDVICNKTIPIDVFDKINVIGGSYRPNFLSSYEFIKKNSNTEQFNIIQKIFKITNKNIKSVNTGVLLFNNKNYLKYGIYNFSVKIFKKSKKNNVERKGDDSLLSLMMLILDDSYFYHLDLTWNRYDYKDLDKSYLIHAYKVKPWSEKISKLPKMKLIYDLWHKNKKMIKNDMELYWYRGDVYNFGDEITPWLFKKMFNYSQDNPTNIKTSKNTVLLAVGSIMRLSCNKTEVWGSGIRNVDQKNFTSSKKYYAVRGLFTRSQLLNLGYDCPEVYGDPGLLLPKYYFPQKEKKYKLGIIPHIVDYEICKTIFDGHKNIKIINLETNNIEEVVNEILECEYTLSSSLHGIITSVAYNIPTRWLKLSNKINGDNVKFYDFFSSLDHNVFNSFDFKNMNSPINKFNPIKIEDNQIIDGETKRMLNVNNLCISTHNYSLNDFDEKKLLESCPFKY
jgi:hypothetical protein